MALFDILNILRNTRKKTEPTNEGNNFDLVKTLKFIGAIPDIAKGTNTGKEELPTTAAADEEKSDINTQGIKDEFITEYQKPEALNRLAPYGLVQRDKKTSKILPVEINKGIENVNKTEITENPNMFDYGEYDNSNKTIEFRRNKTEPAEQTILHELLHSFSYGLPLNYELLQTALDKYIDPDNLEKTKKRLIDKYNKEEFTETLNRMYPGIEQKIASEKYVNSLTDYLGRENEKRAMFTELRKLRKDKTGKDWWDVWTEDDLQGMDETEPLKRLRMLHKDNSIIEMLNTFAATGNKQDNNKA